jgi:hypothetical protein
MPDILYPPPSPANLLTFIKFHWNVHLYETWLQSYLTWALCGYFKIMVQVPHTFWHRTFHVRTRKTQGLVRICNVSPHLMLLKDVVAVAGVCVNREWLQRKLSWCVSGTLPGQENHDKVQPFGSGDMLHCFVSARTDVLSACLYWSHLLSWCHILQYLGILMAVYSTWGVAGFV